MKKCAFCGKEFEPKNPKGKFCSTLCRVKFSRSDKKEYPKTDLPPNYFSMLFGSKTQPPDYSGKKEWPKQDKPLFAAVKMDDIPPPDKATKIAEIEKKIAAKKAEMENYGTGIWGKKSRDKAQLEINALNAELFKLKNQ